MYLKKLKIRQIFSRQNLILHKLHLKLVQKQKQYIHNDEYYYYIVESDEEGNPKYLIQINTNSRGDLITAYLITAEKLK